MRILVTGAAGWAGRPAMKVLRGRGHSVRAFDREAVGDGAAAESVVGDVASWVTMERATVGMDAVLHLAMGGGGPDETAESILRASVVGTGVVLEAARRAGIRRVVVASSGAVVTGYPRGTRIDASTPARFSGLYPLGKWLQEVVAHQYAEEHAMVVPILRPWVIVDAATRRLRTGESLDEQSDPLSHNGAFGWVDRFDFAEACALAIERPLDGAPVFHVMPNRLARSMFDVERTVAKLGWQPRHDFAADVPDGVRPPAPEVVG